MSFHDEDYTPQYYDLDTAPGDQDMEYERQVDGKENRVRRNQGAFLSDDSTNVIHRRKDMQLATNLNDRRAYVQRKCSSDEKRRKISHESCNSVASTANALPVTNTFSEAVNSITGENSLSLVKLGKLVRQFEMNLENKELLATKMKEVNAINLQQVKSMQNAIDSMRPSSDSVVRTLAGIIKEQNNIIAGLSLTDLPESLVTFLINFVLDGVGLYAEELLMSASECARQSNRFWLGLGNDDEARTKMFDRLSEARMKLCGLARVAIGRALGDLRAYHFDAEKEMLSPPSKKRFCPATTQDSLAHEHTNEPEHEQDEDIESLKSI
ncbi:unnamed protein product [Cylicocyclus nassatus]|uniref:Uncharacterized protein n=2 Tax=Cylicocyclus nassatus TaxID=53992 RepID=A0AA36GVC7_CYLNA|nr:unnamed protein product [Cylicocyclus nassatus]